MTAEPFLPVPPAAEHPGATPGSHCHCGRPLPCGWHSEAKPHPKATALARGQRRYRRKVAGPKQWQALHAEKNGPCRVCTAAGPNELHHVVPRGAPWFGSDVADNLVPLCRLCHRKVTDRSYLECLELLETLTDAEYAQAVEAAGESFFERAYGLRYDRQETKP